MTNVFTNSKEILRINGNISKNGEIQPMILDLNTIWYLFTKSLILKLKNKKLWIYGFNFHSNSKYTILIREEI